MLVTRLAPTPSGFLHQGNAVNFVLTWWLARAHGGRLLLRIDDFDVPRLRTAYVDDIFRTVAWLGIDIDAGPSGPADFSANWSMSLRMPQFRAACDRLLRDRSAGVFVCACSRRQLGPRGRCAAGCADRDLTLAPGTSALRMRVAPARIAEGPEPGVPPGDHVLWRRDDLPAYHLGSVVADESLGVSAVVRGVDLRPASMVQRHLAGVLPAPGFTSADLRHHGLLLGPDGTKLSKSAGAQAQPFDHTTRARDEIAASARALGESIGIQPP